MTCWKPLPLRPPGEEKEGGREKKTPEKFGGYAENPLSLQPVSPERVKKRSMVRLHKQQEVVQEQELS